MSALTSVMLCWNMTFCQIRTSAFNAMTAREARTVCGGVLERRATTKNNENQSVCDRFSIVYLPILELPTQIGYDPKEKLITVLMMQAAPLQARYYRSLIRNLTSQALIE